MLLDTYQQQLEQAGIQTARIDALAIMEHVLESDKAQILADAVNMSDEQLAKINSLISTRSQRYPLAYILGYKEFYGRQFSVDKNVLIPRPESEDMVHLALQLNLPLGTSVLDIGCGSGVLGITYALEKKSDARSSKWLILSDISESALGISKQNARRHRVRAQYVVADLLNNEYLEVHADGLILANLPYVPQKLITSPEIEKEPSLALFSGEDGLDHYRTLWQQLSILGDKPLFVITESLDSQFTALDQLAAESSYELFSQVGLARCYRHKSS